MESDTKTQSPSPPATPYPRGLAKDVPQTTEGRTQSGGAAFKRFLGTHWRCN